MNKYPTEELLKILNSADSVSDLKEYDQNLKDDLTCAGFADYISQKKQALGISSGELIQRSGIQRTYGYQILSGEKNPGRDKVIALCLALSLPLDDTQRALTLAKESVLYPRIRRDSIIIFGINNNMSVQDLNDLLFDLKENILN